MDNQYPSLQEEKNILKNSYSNYNYLREYIESVYQINGVYKFSQKSGWNVFFKKGGKSLCYIQLQDSIFKVTIVIGSSIFNDVINSDIGPKTKLMLKNAKQFYDGRWMLFENNTKEEIEDLKKLLNIKKKVKLD